MTDYPMRGGILDELEPPEAYAKRERGIKDRARARQESRKRNALLKWGGEPVLSADDIPSWPEIGRGAMDAVDAVGQAAIPFGPMGAMVGAGAEAVGVGAQALRQVPRWMLGPAAQGADVAAANNAGHAERMAAARAYDAERARESATAAQLSRMKQTGAHPPDVRPPWQDPEYAKAMKILEGNPYTGPIPGRPGFPARQERIDLARRFFQEGGDLRKLPVGPWDQNPQIFRALLKEQYAKEAAKGLVKTKAKKKPGGILDE